MHVHSLYLHLFPKLSLSGYPGFVKNSSVMGIVFFPSQGQLVLVFNAAEFLVEPKQRTKQSKPSHKINKPHSSGLVRFFMKQGCLKYKTYGVKLTEASTLKVFCVMDSQTSKYLQ